MAPEPVIRKGFINKTLQHNKCKKVRKRVKGYLKSLENQVKKTT